VLLLKPPTPKSEKIPRFELKVLSPDEIVPALA
jgi:hypothetical protein